MSIIGKLHEFSLYGLISAIICLIKNRVSVDSLRYAATHIDGFRGVFLSYLFWASALFIPIAIIGAFSTKYRDDGDGLLFSSDNVLVIVFSHIAEELLGLICTPFWFLKDVFTHDLDALKVVDYILYAAELAFIAFGLLSVFK